jgi:hypothetical protein
MTLTPCRRLHLVSGLREILPKLRRGFGRTAAARVGSNLEGQNMVMVGIAVQRISSVVVKSVGVVTGLQLKRAALRAIFFCELEAF